MRHIALTVLGASVIVSAFVLIFAYRQANQVRSDLVVDLQYRTHLLADGLTESIEPNFATNSTTTLQRIIDRFAGRERLAGLVLYDNDASLLAASEGLTPEVIESGPLVSRAMASDEPQGEFVATAEQEMYRFVMPLHQDERVIGAFLVVQQAGYINESVQEVWERNLVRLAVQIVVFSLALGLLVWFLFVRPLRKLTESIRVARMGGAHAPLTGEYAFLAPVAREVSKLSRSLVQARSVATEEARMRFEKLDTPWTAERLQEFIKAHLKDRPIFVVSNREPYIHEKVGRKETRWSVPASGLVTALEPVMVACGGTWLAHGSGSGDKETADASGKIRVPPDEPKYTLKRVWLTKDEVKGHYVGFSNEALWPLCHMAHTRPIFRKEDWLAYRKVNGKFARELLKEMKDVQRPLIIVQDYHFALLPEMILAARPDAEVALFWHIPWPSAEIFSICPWRKEILRGMLGADIIGFHTQQYCNNFLDTVGKEIEALVNLERFSVTREGHTTYIKPFPISIAFTNSRSTEGETRKEISDFEFPGGRIILGVDRLDYTKGILERFKALEFLFAVHPEHVGRVTLVQIAPPSREAVPKYGEYNEAITHEAERINAAFGRDGWRPIQLEKRHFSHDELDVLYRRADVCLITPLHDGMNLVAKEYVAARDDESGVLVLSQLTGAARELKDAILVNPYNAEETADAVHRALAMQPAEQHRRMKSMRESVKNYNVYRWSAELIKALADLG